MLPGACDLGEAAVEGELLRGEEEEVHRDGELLEGDGGQGRRGRRAEAGELVEGFTILGEPLEEPAWVEARDVRQLGEEGGAAVRVVAALQTVEGRQEEQGVGVGDVPDFAPGVGAAQLAQGAGAVVAVEELVATGGERTDDQGRVAIRFAQVGEELAVELIGHAVAVEGVGVELVEGERGGRGGG
jgi:hypothetical protein